MRPLLASLTMLLVLAPWATAAAPPLSLRPSDRLDYLFLGSDRPTLLRLHVRVGDKAYDAPWVEFMDKLFAWFDKDKDGFLSPAEVARLPMPNAILLHAQGAFGADGRTIPFAEIDANKDGKVSKEELRAYYARNGFAGLNFSLQNSQATQAKQINDAILKRLDRKGDGKLTAAKVAGLYEKLRSLDENEDEIITQAELNTKGGGGGYGGVVVFTYGPPPVRAVVDNSLREIKPGQTDSLVRALLAKYDRNKDGKLSRKEIGLGEATFSRLDADKDGFLSPAELGAYLATGEPDFVFRLQLGGPTTGKNFFSKLGLAAVLPAGPITYRASKAPITLVNEKTIDPALKKNYRRGPGDSLAMQLGDTKMSLQIPHGMDTGGGRLDGLKGYHLQLYGMAAGKKDHVTRADLKDPNYQILLAVFSQADKNADGKLTRVELVNWLDFLSTARGVNLTLTCNDLGRSFFDVLDANGDGRLSLREMRSAWKRLGPLAKGGALGQNDLPRTMRLDINWGGGQSFGPVPVAVVEWATGVPTRGRPGAPVWFRKMDKNNDGDISPREWLGTDEEFKAIDADGDGLISAEEAIAFEAKKRKTKD
jgi:Ca2+-binding EF-hand superfamily protein